MSTNQTNNEEEVDLGSLFIIIGKGFSNFFNFIGNVFKGIFHLIILFLLFIRKSAIKIIIVGFSFGLIGFFLDYNKEVVFESKMLVQPNFNSAKQLYSNISFYNDLVLQKENSLIASIFNITDKEAESLRSFYIEPIINGNDIINGYDKLALSVDTLAIKDYSIKEYRNTFTDFDYSVHEIKIKATENKIFIKLDSTILNSISNNTFFKNVKNLENLNLNRSYDLYEKNLKETDTLRKVYMTALLEESKKTTQGTSIDMGGASSKNKEIQLFSTVRELNSYLNNVNNEKANKSEIVNVISSFPKVGNKSGGLLNSKVFVFFALGVLGTIFILLLMQMNNYLNNYKK